MRTVMFWKSLKCEERGGTFRGFKREYSQGRKKNTGVPSSGNQETETSLVSQRRGKNGRGGVFQKKGELTKGKKGMK